MQRDTPAPSPVSHSVSPRLFTEQEFHAAVRLNDLMVQYHEEVERYESFHEIVTEQMRVLHGVERMLEARRRHYNVTVRNGM
jgi:hypothetical protein